MSRLGSVFFHSPNRNNKNTALLSKITHSGTYIFFVRYLIMKHYGPWAPDSISPPFSEFVSGTPNTELLLLRNYPVTFEIYIMKRCCFSLWNEYVARLTALEPGTSVTYSFLQGLKFFPNHALMTIKSLSCDETTNMITSISSTFCYIDTCPLDWGPQNSLFKQSDRQPMGCTRFELQTVGENLTPLKPMAEHPLTSTGPRFLPYRWKNLNLISISWALGNCLLNCTLNMFNT